jgi:two-component system, chemotaxis family, protein-glutamate methylesterase/glutaminase
MAGPLAFEHDGFPLERETSSPGLVVIAASAGALEALIEVLSPLPADFAAAIAIVQHRGPSEPERLVELLDRSTCLRVIHAVEGAVLEAGTVYVCPPGMHMTTEHCVRLIDGPRLRHVKPSADLMFESAGRTYGERAIGVVLSGCGSDAAAGSLAIAEAGGLVLAQDPRTCRFGGMPKAAVRAGAVERVLAPAQIAEMLCSSVGPDAGARRLDAASGLRASATSPLRILLVDDHQIVLDGLRVLLEREPDMTVIAAAEEGVAAVRSATEARPDIVVMDVRMPGLDGIEATRLILSSQPWIKVVALSAEHDARLVDCMLNAGAAGYLSKEQAFGELVCAIRAVMRGELYVSRAERYRSHPT